jgi:hypothetical protein
VVATWITRSRWALDPTHDHIPPEARVPSEDRFPSVLLRGPHPFQFSNNRVDTSGHPLSKGSAFRNSGINCVHHRGREAPFPLPNLTVQEIYSLVAETPNPKLVCDNGQANIGAEPQTNDHLFDEDHDDDDADNDGSMGYRETLYFGGRSDSDKDFTACSGDCDWCGHGDY